MSPSQHKFNLTQDHCAVLTGSGRSAIAVIGLRGVHADQIVRRCFAAVSSSRLSAGQVRYGSWTGRADTEVASESVVLTPIADGHFEIHCHGGSAAVERIIADLRDCGVIQVESADWNHVENRLIAEAQQVLLRCLTARTAAIALDQARGALADWVSAWIAKLSPDPQEFGAGPVNQSGGLSASAFAGLPKEARTILAFAPVATRLAEPFHVVLIGPPNVGKSSLVNALLGYDRSITFDQAGTTRDVLHADTVIDGLPIRLSDTAGIRESDQAIEQQGIARARAAANQADLILSISSPESPALALGPGLGENGPATGTVGTPAILRVFNKIDLLDSDKTTTANAWSANDLSTNALNGDGIPLLLQAIADSLGQTMPSPRTPVPLCKRQVDLLSAIAESNELEKSLNLLEELLGRPAVALADENDIAHEP